MLTLTKFTALLCYTSINADVQLKTSFAKSRTIKMCHLDHILSCFHLYIHLSHVFPCILDEFRPSF